MKEMYKLTDSQFEVLYFYYFGDFIRNQVYRSQLLKNLINCMKLNWLIKLINIEILIFKNP